jgi:hypothetical protein
MRANITSFLPIVAFFERLPALELGSGIPSREKLSHQNDVPACVEVGGADAYKVTVLLLAGAAILSLF